MADDAGEVRRAYGRATLAGGAAALVLFYWMATAGTWHPLPPSSPLLGFYDLQARALMHGHLYVPNGSAWIEGIVRGSRTYVYFGPWPAILRMPLLAVTHRYDARLGVLSMTLACAVALWSTGRLLARARLAVRGDTPVGPGEWWAAAAAVFAAGAGSTVMFLGGAVLEYHEAGIWGVAAALASFQALVRWCDEPRARTLVVAGAWATVAFLSRPSVGAGPAVALALVALDRAVASATGRTPLLARSAPPAGRSWRAAARDGSAPLAAAVVPAVLYALQNYAKFHTLFNTPFQDQVFSRFDAHRRAALAANHGTLFGFRLIPTSVVQYLRPDALHLTSTFPFVDFSGRPPHVFLGAVFDTLDHTSSITATMPALCVLAIAGIGVAFARRGRRPGRDLRSWRAPLIAATLGLFPTVWIAFEAQRYLADFVPVLVIGAALGFALVTDAGALAPDATDGEGRPGRRHRRRRPAPGGRIALAGVLGVLAAFGVLVNTGLGLQYQRVYSAMVTRTQRADFVSFRQRVARDLGFGGLPVRAVAPGSRLPRAPGTQALAEVGRCDGLYAWNLSNWYAITRTRATGQVAEDVTVTARLPRRTSVELARFTAAPDAVVVLESRGNDRWDVRMTQGGSTTRGPQMRLPRGTHRAVVAFDPYLRVVEATVDGDEALRASWKVPATAAAEAGGVAARVVAGSGIPGVEIGVRPDSRARCRALTSP